MQIGYLISGIMLPLVQHWFTLLIHAHFGLYVAVQILIEIFLEWIIIAYLERFYEVHRTAALASLVLLLSQWVFLAAGSMELIASSRP